MQSALAFHSLPVMEEPGGDAPAPSDAHQGKQQLCLPESPTFLPIPIFPNYRISELVVVQKKLTLMPQSAQSWEGYNFQFGQLIGNTMTGHHSCFDNRMI